MRTDLEHLTLKSDASIKAAMAQIDKNRAGIVMVVNDEGKLLGTITDGDVRRAILASTSLETLATSIMCDHPTVLRPSFKTVDAQELMAQRRLRHLPVVAEDGQVKGLIGLDDLWAQPQVSDKLSAVVMAGGLGSRLRPLTNTTPKPLIPVGGKPILERIVEHLHGAGVEQLVITTRYMADQVEGYFKDGDDWGVHIDYIREQERRGTAGALRELAGEVDHAFLVMNGDLLTDFPVKEMHQFHQAHDALMTVGVRQYKFQVPYGVAQVEGVRITALSEKPTYDFFVNAGIYILEPELLDLIPEGYYDITELIEKLVEQDKTVVSFPIHEQWMDIGRPEDLELANALFSKSE